ncbi:hypothetical protein [Nocardioides gansuensis]|nr:hypothetical protein [Nocardioides gansuensis]
MAAVSLPFGWERAHRYGTAMAQLSLEDAAVEELFNTALTHGLLAITSATIVGHPSTRPGRQPSASKLLRDLVKTFGESEGVCRVPTNERDSPNPFGVFGDDYQPPSEVAINTLLLSEALELADAARHGSGPTGQLTSAHISALEALDAHPALRAIGDAKRDLDWSGGVVADAHETARAAEYLEMLSDEEMERRAEAVSESPIAPAWDDYPELQDCPVCGYASLIPTGGDEMGYGITAGTCFVCSYARSEDAAHELQFSAEIQRLSDKDPD